MRPRNEPWVEIMITVALFAMLAGCSAPENRIVIDIHNQKPISPYVYGINSTDWDKFGPGFTLGRLGGNRLTAYNWETNASNAGSDWHHQNDSLMGETDEAGAAIRQFVQGCQKHGAAAIVTVPTAGYVAADKKGDGDVNQTPNYLETRFNKSLAHKGAAFQYPPDTTDHKVYQDEMVWWLEKIKSNATPVWYMLDNEPDLWSGTHARIWPKNPTYAQIIANNIEFGSAIKDVAKKTLVFGPANYGYMGFRTFQNAPDANGRDFLDAYLDAMKDAEHAKGKRILDVLDIHFYPEARGDGVRICEGVDKPGTPAARVQAPRSLWDPTYVEDSWITQSRGGKAIALLPGINAQISKHYPGTKLSMSEYNYGGGQVISGAIAQADVLGIYGRYGLFAACNWGISPKDVAEVAGFRSFVNFDGNGAKFGDLGLGVSGEQPAADSVYAALDSKNQNRLTIVAINKSTEKLPLHFLTKGFTAKNGTAYVVTDQALDAPSRQQVQTGNEDAQFVAPPLSVTTIVLTK